MEICIQLDPQICRTYAASRGHPIPLHSFSGRTTFQSEDGASLKCGMLASALLNTECIDPSVKDGVCGPLYEASKLGAENYQKEVEIKKHSGVVVQISSAGASTPKIARVRASDS